MKKEKSTQTKAAPQQTLTAKYDVHGDYSQQKTTPKSSQPSSTKTMETTE